MKILLVEDDTMIASGLMYALEQEGYEPFHCMTASDAVHRIKTELYDLAILDMQLPDGTGFDVSRALKWWMMRAKLFPLLKTGRLIM